MINENLFKCAQCFKAHSEQCFRSLIMHYCTYTLKTIVIEKRYGMELRTE